IGLCSQLVGLVSDRSSCFLAKWDRSRPKSDRLGSLSYIGFLRIEQRVKRALCWVCARPPRDEATAQCRIGFQPVSGSEGWTFEHPTVLRASSRRGIAQDPKETGWEAYPTLVFCGSSNV